MRGKLADINVKLSALERTVDRLEAQVRDASEKDSTLENESDLVPVTQ